MGNFYQDSLKGIKTTGVCKDAAKLEPGTRIAVEAVLADCKAQGMDVRLLETYRSQARQTLLYKQKATQLRTVGTHGYGLAADLGLFKNGKLDPVGEHYRFLAPLCLKHGLIWGGDWGEPDKPHSFRDWDHVQRVPVFRQQSLFTNAWYPPQDYDPHADLKAHG